MGLLFVFDMDHVLYDYDWRRRMAGLTRITGHDLAELRRRWWTREGELGAEAGRFADGDEYLAAFNAALGADLSRADWIANRAGAMTPWPESIAHAEYAGSHGTVSLLTNNGPLMHEHLAEVAPALVPVFGDHLRATSHYGARKPDPIVFERVLAEYDVPAHDVFFADDLADNVEAAVSVGITGHRYRDAAGLGRAIEQFIAARS